MLHLTTYLLICLIEECAEIIHRCCKSIRFGMEECQAQAYKDLKDVKATSISPDSEKYLTNKVRLEQELADLQGVVQLLQQQKVITGMAPHTETKKKKVLKYLEYSVKLGLAEKEAQEKLRDAFLNI